MTDAMSSGGPHPDAGQHRPPKRPRTQFTSDHSTQPLLGPVDHIFIADGVSAKKGGAKKTPLSCCECRRLKLKVRGQGCRGPGLISPSEKCDRNFPCASCKKRGCAEICPNGVLVSGKGTRFILANTEQLHSKIHEMSNRIRLLEDALGRLHKTHEVFLRKVSHLGYHQNGYREADEEDEGESIPPHPLLVPELLSVKSSMELYTNAGNAPNGHTPGNKSQEGQGHSEKSNGGDPGNSSRAGTTYSMDVDLPFQKQRGSSEEDSAMVLEDYSPGLRTNHYDSSSRAGSDRGIDYSSQIGRLSEAFPLSTQIQHSNHHDHDLTWTDHEHKLALREYIRNQLPPRHEAEYLWVQARKNALWQFNPHPSPTFFSNLLHHVYHSPLADLCPRRLSLLLMIFAVGCHVDLEERVAPKPTRYTIPDAGQPTYPPAHAGVENPLAERYHQLARASLCEVPMMEETNVDIVLALFWEIWYLLVFSDRKKAASYAWGLMGLTSKLAQTLGLHRNEGKAKVIPEEVEKRRALFWELVYLDARLSLSLGRPPSLPIGYVDCLRPSYLPDEDVDIQESSHYYQEWKHSYFIECLSPVLEAISQPGSKLQYGRVIELDRQIRDFPIPDSLQNWNNHHPRSRAFIMQKGSLCTGVEALLLQLHRTFFTRALSGFDEAFNYQHRYAPSVVAVFLSSARMIASVQDLYRREPQITSRILGYWSNAFSATVALCLLVCRAPFTCLSPAALQEIERARLLFRTAKDTCPRALQVLPILESMIDKANDIYHRWFTKQEIPTMILRHTNAGLPSDGAEPRDPFLNSHSSLKQCIAESHDRARVLFPLRKPCECSGPAQVCPPSHSWMPPPQLPAHEPTVLPPEAPSVRTTILQHGSTGTSSYPSPPPYHRGGDSNPYGTTGRFGSSSAGLYSARVLPINGPALQPPPPIATLSPASKMAVVDTLNFELGALNANTEHNWMAFF